MNHAKAFLQIQKNSLWTETFGIVTAEAMLNGCPVIFIDNGANRELIDLVNGGVEYFPTSNPQKLLKKFDLLMLNPCKNYLKKLFQERKSAWNTSITLSN